MAFENIINQKKAKEIITGQLKSGKIPHAYLFLGEEGTGRKKTALELAKILNCADGGCGKCASCNKIEHGIHPDVRVIDFEYQANLENKDIDKQKSIKIDTIRAVQREVSLKPSEGKWKVFIIEPAEKITLDAANCLLKTLEEPPEWTLLILLAKNRENLPATVVSRTQMIPFVPLPEEKREAGDDSLSELWSGIRDNTLSAAELLGVSRENSKNASDFVERLIDEIRADFEKRPEMFRQAMESAISSKKFLTKNAGAQLVLDELLIALSSMR